MMLVSHIGPFVRTRSSGHRPAKAMGVSVATKAERRESTLGAEPAELRGVYEPEGSDFVPSRHVHENPELARGGVSHLSLAPEK
jgi:hypothetical protein